MNFSSYYRYNPEDELEALEEQYSLTPEQAILDKINTLRLARGLEEREPFITLLNVVSEVVGPKESYSGADFEEVGVPFFAGCQICQESLGPYNAYPSKNGYIRCRACIGDIGYRTVKEFNDDRTADYDEEPPEEVSDFPEGAPADDDDDDLDPISDQRHNPMPTQHQGPLKEFSILRLGNTYRPQFTEIELYFKDPDVLGKVLDQLSELKEKIVNEGAPDTLAISLDTLNHPYRLSILTDQATVSSPVDLDFNSKVNLSFGGRYSWHVDINIPLSSLAYEVEVQTYFPDGVKSKLDYYGLKGSQTIYDDVDLLVHDIQSEIENATFKRIKSEVIKQKLKSGQKPDEIIDYYKQKYL